MVMKNNIIIEKYNLEKIYGAFDEVLINDEYIIIDKEMFIQFFLDELINGSYESLLLNDLRHNTTKDLKNNIGLYQFINLCLDDIIKDLIKTLIKLYDGE